DNLDLTGASLTVQNNVLVATIKARNLNDLTVDSSNAGGSNGAWILRWTQVDPTQPGNGHIYYAGMESDGGGDPTFFDGDVMCGVVTTHCKQMAFPQTNTITGSVDKAAGTITLNVPLPDIG